MVPIDRGWAWVIVLGKIGFIEYVHMYYFIIMFDVFLGFNFFSSSKLYHRIFDNWKRIIIWSLLCRIHDQIPGTSIKHYHRAFHPDNSFQHIMYVYSKFKARILIN